MYALETVGGSAMSLKPEQKACRECVFDGKDAFVWLPTGSGKSICLPFMSRLTRSLAETTALLSLFTAIFSSSLQRVQLTFALQTNV